MDTMSKKRRKGKGSASDNGLGGKFIVGGKKLQLYVCPGAVGLFFPEGRDGPTWQSKLDWLANVAIQTFDSYRLLPPDTQRIFSILVEGQWPVGLIEECAPGELNTIVFTRLDLDNEEEFPPPLRERLQHVMAGVESVVAKRNERTPEQKAREKRMGEMIVNREQDTPQYEAEFSALMESVLGPGWKERLP
jgi:hypothetical protein